MIPIQKLNLVIITLLYYISIFVNILIKASNIVNPQWNSKKQFEFKFDLTDKCK